MSIDISGGRWTTLECNVVTTNRQTMTWLTVEQIVVYHPSAIKCGISCIVLEKRSVHLRNALSM